MLAALKSSTSVAGVIAAVGFAAQVVIEMAEAPPKWRLIALLVNALAVAALGILARDNKKTSEDVGAPNATKPIASDVAIQVAPGVDPEALRKAVQEAVTSALALRKPSSAPPAGPSQ